MRNAQTVLAEKERDLRRVRREVESLQIAIPLLEEEDYLSENLREVELGSLDIEPQDSSTTRLQSTGTEGPIASDTGRSSGFWKRIRGE